MTSALFWALFASGIVLTEGGDIAHETPTVAEVLHITPLLQKESTILEPIVEPQELFAAIILDPKTGQVLYQHNADREQYIASITKLMTVQTALQTLDPNDVITVPFAATRTGGAGIGLQQGEQITAETLAEAALIPSANDAATALAYAAHGSPDAHTEAMNQRVQDLGLMHTTFVNVTGLDVPKQKPINAPVDYDPEHNRNWTGNKSTAREVAHMATTTLRNSWLSETVSKRVFSGTSIDGNTVHQRDNTNKLLWGGQRVTGVKTGYTELAKQCLITRSTHPNGRELITVVLGAEDRFAITKALLDWVYAAYY